MGPDAQRLSFGRLLAFSLPGVPIGGLAVAMTVYVPRYYAAHFALGLSAVGAAFMSVRLIDMFFDPVIGAVMDRTRTRVGRYRAWLIAGAPLLAIPVVMLFIPPGPVSYAYLVGWLLIFYVGGSVVTLSHMSWASVVAASYHERSRVFGAIQITSVIAATLVLVIPSLVGSRSGAGDVQAMGWFIALAAPLGIALAASATAERITPDVGVERFRVRDYLEMLARPDMRRIVLCDACLTLGPQWMSAIYLFYFHDARGFTDAQSRYLLALYVVAGILGAGVLSWLATRIGKHRTLMISAAGYSLGLTGLSFVPKGAFAPMLGFMFAMGFLSSSFVVLVRAMTADVGDAVRLETGRNRIGLLFAFLTSTEKIANALSIGLTFGVLALIGYDAREGAANTAGAIGGLELVFLIGPISFVMLGAASLVGYQLDHRRHAAIRQALDEQDAAHRG
ncbi:MAG: MFS transporter [Caulobacteraceae bacterium]|nr:MFS transporter [Caulobacteraceae bacterium]